MSKNKFYVTTPIYYVNAKPHLGTLYSTLVADTAARWHKILGKEVFFLTGTDEHGQKIQEKAEQEGKDPKAFTDSMIEPFKRVWKLYGIEYDRFIRTTDEDHKGAVKHWIEQLKEQGDIYKDSYSGWYCVPCEAFVNAETEAEKDDEGTYLCPAHKKPLTQLSEESYFFKLSNYQEKLLEFYNQNPNFITPKERMNEVLSFVKSGLKDLSISRKTVSWGIPFPGDEEHTVYVWGDALNNYISALGYGQNDEQAQKNFEHWWPADMQVLAKDIVRFHAVYWPAFLMAAGIELPKRLLVHGYVLMDKQKMSKSLGNAIDPDVLAESYGVDQVRYYLMRKMAITQDGSFSLQDLEEHVTADLANNLGNLLNRTISLAHKNGVTEIAPRDFTLEESKELHKKYAAMFNVYAKEMTAGYYHMALAELWKFISEVNAYFHKMQPWLLARKDKEKFVEVITAACNSLYTIGIMLWPVMPNKMEELLKALGKEFVSGTNYGDVLSNNIWNGTFVLTKQDEPLFVRPEVKVEEPAAAQKETKEAKKEEKKDDSITIQDFWKVDIRTGTVLSCERVPKSDKLYKFEVDFGPLGKRQILSGVAKELKEEQLLGKQGVFVVNLPPRKMMGLESQGMMLFVEEEGGTMQIVTAGDTVKNGSKVC